MSKFTDGYQTTLGSRFNTTRLSEAISESLIRDNLLTSSLDVKKLGPIYPVFITSLQDSEEKIPLFAHPYAYRTRDGNRLMVTDMRLYLRKRIFDGTLTSLSAAISSQVEYNFARSRAILNIEWLEGDVEALKINLYFSTMMFGRWMADILARAYALNPMDQLIIAITASYYYQSLFTDETDYDEETLQKWQIHTSKVTAADAKTVNKVFEKMPMMKGVDTFVEGVKATTDNIRLKDLNVLTLLTLLKNSWYGTNSKDIIAVATEHPPTWMAIIHAALEERSYRQSLIYKIAERVGKRGIADDYVKQYHKILSDYNITSTHSTLAVEGLA